MKYVLLGNLNSEWANKQSERVGKAKAKLDKLGIKIESIHYTQGYYDFVDIVDARILRRSLRFPSGTPPRVWDGSKVCRPSRQRPLKPRSRPRRTERRIERQACSQLSDPLPEERWRSGQLNPSDLGTFHGRNRHTMPT
ncbi:hypothetical protein IVB18_33425 [Bradyrhizobium sp. 186]|uniref:hypothetical protein n=1 Tax=Bradyrhizobium sp. 186 TaxID=2782654 RepID=UPI002001A825|nr:hypothetical protein [Bradyrhizobium sp. 186]UPK33100.1 hypothetical protein IVB18_33425 [Bradyrhizobium sp. 186]